MRALAAAAQRPFRGVVRWQNSTTVPASTAFASLNASNFSTRWASATAPSTRSLSTSSSDEKATGKEEHSQHKQKHGSGSGSGSGAWWKNWRRWAVVGGTPAPFALWFGAEHISEEEKARTKTAPAFDAASADHDAKTGLPIILHEEVFAPNVPPPVNRRTPALVRVKMRSEVTDIQLSPKYKYHGWSFNGKVPGPFLRVRVGDTLEVIHENLDATGMQHNIDFHAVMGSGGGAPLLNADSETERTARFKMLYPGLYIYHCAAGPLPMHIGNGMYGLILVEPEGGLPKVDREWYVLQSEFYVDQSTIKDDGAASFDYEAGLKEQPEMVVFNGREGALTHGNVLQARINDRCRIFFGNAGPNLLSTFHVIGAVFENVYRDGSVVDPPSKFTQNVLVGPGSAAVVEFTPQVPGNYTLVDHAIFRTDKGAVGFINVKGAQQPQIYSSTHTPNPCPNCKLHP